VTRVLIVGMSTRAAAESAARAGLKVTAIDAYADRDQHPSVHALSMSSELSSPPTAGAIARAARRIDCDAVAYLSPFENHPRAVSTVAAGRTLWGNPPETLRRVRNPFEVADVLRRNGFRVPRLLSHDPKDPNDSNRWLLKPFRSGGGKRIRCWQRGTVPRACYLQERIDGWSGSLVFVAADGICVPLGFSRQLVGDSLFGGDGYRYCGSIVAPIDDPQLGNGKKLLEAAIAVAQCVTSEFRLIGLNGIDFIACDGTAYPVEVNPRWSSSMEVAETLLDVTLFSAHLEACARGTLPAFNLARALERTRAVGKAIVYARRASSIGDTSAWLGEPTVRDVPHSGECFRPGQPVCTVLATGRDGRECHRLLAERANRIYAQLDASAVRRRDLMVE
jgi:predicted ATP-grasp superfamily ATP-dependent carboligase